MSFNVKFDMKCTMIDGKVANTLTNQDSSQNCNICGVSTKYITNIPRVLSLSCNEQYYKFGFPVLHSWIRFMENILHIAYNFDFKKGSARKDNKELRRLRKNKIQFSLKIELNLPVDIVKQGAGTTNTGNVACSFFSQEKEVSRITGVNLELIKRYYTIFSSNFVQKGNLFGRI